MASGSSNRLFIVAGVALAVVAGGALWWRNRAAETPVEEPPVAAAPAAPADADPPVEHPIADAPTGPDVPALPALGESDVPLAGDLAGLFGPEAVEMFLEPQNVARRIVATVDGLPRAHGADRLRPVKPVSPSIAVDRQAPSSVTADERITLSPQNVERYKPLIALLETADAQSIATLYQRWYPLLQQSYEELGYPGRYFNDRLVTVIDHLLQTPKVKGPIELTQPNVLYEFADPQLEALSSGQKLILRMGPENAARVLARLKELRTIVATAPGTVPATPARPPVSVPTAPVAPAATSQDAG